MSRVSLAGSAGQVCYGTGSFMALPPPKGVTLHPVPRRNRNSPEPSSLDERKLDSEEKRILARADAALTSGGNFIEKFWGGAGTLANGLHVGNRVGHAQGGIQMALAAANAGSALPAGWQLSGISAWFISPGEGRTLRAVSKLVHQGRLTAVVRTQINGRNRRPVLEAVTTHNAATS
jgi:acyl-coenzyme A thioesterase PaaI-like protein